jgi:DNA-binding Lrp family transcriptional regulator
MINAYILTIMKPGNAQRAIEEMKNIDHVEKISVVAGEFDIVVRVRVNDLEQLLDLTNKLQMINGVEKTTTQIIEKEIAL